MYRISSSLSACLMTLVLLNSVDAQEAQTTTWKGSLDAGETEPRLEIDITDNDGTFTGEMRSLANAAPGADYSEEPDQALEAVIQMIPELEREASANAIRAEIAGQTSGLLGNWMPFFLSHDPRPALRNIACPVLAIIGTKDTQVLPDLNMPELENALTEGGNKDFETAGLDGLNHLFQECETGAMSENVTIQETFNPGALAAIGDWIVRHTSPVK